MGEKMIYLDNSATTKQYREVTEIMVRYMEEDFGNPSSLYQLGVDSERAVRKARKQVKEAMNAGKGIFISPPAVQRPTIWLSWARPGLLKGRETE